MPSLPDGKAVRSSASVALAPDPHRKKITLPPRVPTPAVLWERHARPSFARRRHFLDNGTRTVVEDVCGYASTVS